MSLREALSHRVAVPPPSQLLSASSLPHVSPQLLIGCLVIETFGSWFLPDLNNPAGCSPEEKIRSLGEAAGGSTRHQEAPGACRKIVGGSRVVGEAVGGSRVVGEASVSSSEAAFSQISSRFFRSHSHHCAC